MEVIDPSIGSKIHIMITLNNGNQPEGGVSLKICSSRSLDQSYSIAILFFHYSKVLPSGQVLDATQLHPMQRFT